MCRHCLILAASQSGRHLAPSFALSPLCRTCKANQSLQLHLLASYPFDSDDDDNDDHGDSSATRYHEAESRTSPCAPPLDEYRRSLDTRYPSLCAECAPAVEQAIRRSDERGKGAALRYRLKQSQAGQEKKRDKRGGQANSWRWRTLKVLWLTRGVLCMTTHLIWILACFFGEFGGTIITQRYS